LIFADFDATPQHETITLQSGEEIPLERWNAEIKACVERGRAYFTEIGSFPKLSDGRDAMEVARECCERTPFTAF
jgi:hypothetical protein